VPHRYTAEEREFHLETPRARLEQYRAEGVTHIEIMSARNDGVCVQCAALDGKVFAIDQVPDLPLHLESEETWYICRCIYMPAQED